MASQGGAMLLDQARQGKQAEAIGFGANSLPTPLKVGLLIAEQLTGYTDHDMRKIAMDVKNKIPGADLAFRFIYRAMQGWE